jgi:putative peptide zinc metalloprotease protein
MTMTGSLLEQRPALRPEIRIGPALLRGPATVYLLKDPVAERCYEVGAREHFVIARLDGTRSLAVIGEDYARTFGRTLGEGSWRQLVGLLHGRSLLAGGPAPTAPDTAAAGEAGGNEATPAGGWRAARQGKVSLANPAALLDRWHRRVRLAFSAYVVVPLLILVVAMEVILAAHPGALLHQALALRGQPELIMLDMLLLWVSLGLHEVAHGVTSTHFGGHPSEIGVRWRLPWVFLYCRVDDVLLLPSRWRRVAIASAGVVTNLTLLLPFFALWALVPAGSVLQSLAAFMLLIGSVGALANVLPFFKLDGEMALSHSLNVLNLSAGSWGYVRALIAGLARRGPPANSYPAWARAVYAAYALAQAGFIAAVVAALAVAIQVLLIPRFGDLLWLVVAGIGGFAILGAAAARLISARRTGTPPTGARRTAFRSQETPPS